jgi:ankyrin repeat protein
MNLTRPGLPRPRWIAVILTLLIVIAGCRSRAAAAPETPAELLQKGLVEEEAHRDIEAAIKAYEGVVAQVDAQRRIAATAIFRLGESYRKLGRTNEAALQYQRILREFPSEEALSKLSRENLTGMGIGEARTARLRSAQGQAAARKLLEEEIHLVEQRVQEVETQVKLGVEAASAAIGPKRELLALRRQLLELEADTAPPAATQAATPDPEAAEISRLESIVRHSPDLLNAPEKGGDTPLQQAAAAGQVRVAEFLLQNGAEPDLPGRHGYPAAHLAARYGHKGVLELLFKYRTPVDLRSSSGLTPLQVAAAAGHRAVVETLLSAGADINATGVGPGAGSNGRMNFTVSASLTPLAVALVHRQTAIAEQLIKAGADVNKAGAEGHSPLAPAAGFGTVALVDQLLKAGAAISPASTNDQPLVEAMANPDTRVLERLIERRGDARGEPGVLALREGVNRLATKHVRVLLANGADPNVPFGPDRNTLVLACLNRVGPNQMVDPPTLRSTLECLTLLVEAKANLNQTSQWGARPLLAALNSRTPLPLVQLLVKAGVDVNVRARDSGFTAVTLAALEGRTILRVLLEARANPNLRNGDGSTAIEAVRRQGSRKAIPGGFGGRNPGPPPLPVAVSVDTPRDSQGLSPEEEALEHNPDALVALLTEFGAREDMPNRDEIRVSRRTTGYSQRVFRRGKDTECPHTLFELLAVTYGFLTAPEPAVAWASQNLNHRQDGMASLPGHPLGFPDLKGIRLLRALPDDKWQEILPFKEQWDDAALEWGDVVDIPEVNHPVGQSWHGPNIGTHPDAIVVQGLPRVVKIQVAGNEQSVSLDHDYLRRLQTQGRARTFTLSDVLYASGLVLTSSDITRVQVTRAKGGKSWTFDLANPGPEPDFWVRDGDRIEAPDRK